MEWISVNKKMPTKGHEVIVFDRAFGFSQVSTATWNGKEWEDYIGNRHVYSGKITHWQPRPKYPKK